MFNIPRPERSSTIGPRGRDWLQLSEEVLPTLRQEGTQPLPRPEPGQPNVPGYEILGILGRGGVGIVYKARQTGLGRVVALKMLLAGQHSDATSLARFRSEGEAIARLQHPNIVQIFEVGSHEGLPYLVLEYVPGGGLDDWLRHGPASSSEAAVLVETVARAVHAAHQHGIVHRDLKPANILLALPSPSGGVHLGAVDRADTATKERQPAGAEPSAAAGDSPAPLTPSPAALAETGDTSPTLADLGGWRLPLTRCLPKVADFGLAKQIGATFLAGHSRGADLTRTGVILGTPAYMAPEQIGARHGVIGPATDVYALGVILYELIAGRPPFPPGEAADVLFHISLRDPISPRYWRPKLPADLETICLKCLRKEARERYATALDLADDLRRFLEHKPVHARPLGPLGRGWRWCRRHLVTTALMVLVMLLVAATATTSTLGFFFVQAQQKETEIARQDAVFGEQQVRTALGQEQRRRRQLQEALGTVAPALLEDLLTAEPELTPEHRTLLRQLGAVFADFAADARQEAKGWRDAAVALGYLGRIRQRLGHPAEAEPAFREAIALFDNLASGGDRDTGRSAGAYRVELGRLFAAQNRWNEAMTQLVEGRTILFRLAMAQPDDAVTRHHLAVCCAALGGVLRQQGRFTESESLYCQAVSLHAALVLPTAEVPEQPPRLRERHDLVRELHELSQVENDLHRPDQWEACLEVALAVLYDLPPGVAPSADRDELLATIHNDLGVYLMRNNRLAEAERQFQQAIRQGELLVTRFPNNRSHALLLGGSYTNLGGVLGRTGRPALALDWHRKALEVLQPVFEKDPANSKARHFLRNTSINRASALEALDRFGEAASDWEWAARLTTGRDRAYFLMHQASSLLRAGDVDRAVTIADEAAKESDASAATLYSLASIQARAAAQYAEGKPERQGCCARAVELLRRAREAGFFREAQRLEAFKREECFNLLRNRQDFRTIFPDLE